MLVAFMAASVSAQSPYQSIDEKDNSYVNARQERVINKNVRFADVTAAPALRSTRENPTELDPSLFVQPEGELQLMRRSGIDYLPVWGSPAPAEYTEKGTYVVKGTDGNYYFKNFITNMCNGGTWVKGEVEGNVITVKTGQINAQLWYDNGSTNQLYTYYLHALKPEEATGVDWQGNEYTYTVFVPDETVTEIKFNIEADGTIIPYEKIRKMNIRNVRGLVGQDVIDDYISAKEPRKSGIGLDKEFYGRKIYVRKMERIYHLIRLYKTRDWWE